MFFFCFCLDNSSLLEFQACAPITGWWLLFLFVCFLISLWLFFWGGRSDYFKVRNSNQVIWFNELYWNNYIQQWKSINATKFNSLPGMRPSVLCLITNILLWIVESQAGKKSQKPFCKTPLSNNSCDGFPFYFSVSTQNS